MKREKIFNAIGFLLLALCFGVALVRVFNRDIIQRDGRTVVRFAHWQLEGGLREAFDQLSRDYEKLHPDIRVEQIAIPERTFPQWVKTQLIAGTASEIIELSRTTADEDLARYFVPLTHSVETTNPYNQGSPLEITPWRETFIDGMASNLSYRPNLLEYYGIPMSMATIRMFYNKSLWHEVLGDTPTPENFDEFMALCNRIQDYAKTRQIPLIPIAGSKLNATMFIAQLYGSQTQKLTYELNREHSLKPISYEIALAYLRGDWSVDTPAFADALAITREVGLTMQPGFQQLGREDATFYFVQGRAMMITTGSWDSPSFRILAPFEIGVFNLPIPTRNHPRYGRNVLGPQSEAETNTSLTFGIVRGTPGEAAALDFLKYITSVPGNTHFTHASGWLPSVIGIETSEELEPFLPRVDGYANGFDHSFMNVGANTLRVAETSLATLVGPAGSVKAYQDAVRPLLTESLQADLDRGLRNSRQNVARQDVILAANQALLSRPGDDQTTLLRKISEISEAQNQQESQQAWISHELARLPVK